jgi:hypothetical protein
MAELAAKGVDEDHQMEPEDVEAETEASAEAAAMQVVDSVIAAGKKIQAEAKAQAAATAGQTSAEQILRGALQNDADRAGENIVLRLFC